jgi:hypothetical protein
MGKVGLGLADRGTSNRRRRDFDQYVQSGYFDIENPIRRHRNLFAKGQRPKLEADHSPAYNSDIRMHTELLPYTASWL